MGKQSWNLVTPFILLFPGNLLSAIHKKSHGLTTNQHFYLFRPWEQRN